MTEETEPKLTNKDLESAGEKTKEAILQWFKFEHLPEKPFDLRGVSREFASMALHMVCLLPRNPERTVALRKLLESKDAAVRAMMFNEAFTTSDEKLLPGFGPGRPDSAG